MDFLASGRVGPEADQSVVSEKRRFLPVPTGLAAKKNGRIAVAVGLELVWPEVVADGACLYRRECGEKGSLALRPLKNNGCWPTLSPINRGGGRGVRPTRVPLQLLRRR